MSAVLLMKQSVGRLPSCVVRPGVACCYHTKKGVYGYRPKRSDSPQQYPTAPYQGQYWVNGLLNITSRPTNVAKMSAFITFDFMLFSVLVLHLRGVGVKLFNAIGLWRVLLLHYKVGGIHFRCK